MENEDIFEDLYKETDIYAKETGENVTEYFSVKESLDRAKENGWDVVFPESNQLQLDLDNYTAYLDCIKKLNWMKKFGEFRCGYTVGRSKSDNWHITVNFKNRVMGDLERIALQAILGSDFKKELISFMRVEVGEADPCLLFELPGRPEPTYIK